MLVGGRESLFVLGAIAILYLIYKNSKEKKPVQKEVNSDSYLDYDPVYDTPKEVNDNLTISQEIDAKIQKSSTEQTWKIVAIVFAILLISPVLGEILEDIPDFLEIFKVENENEDQNNVPRSYLSVEDAADKVTSGNTDELLRLEFVRFGDLTPEYLTIQIFDMDVMYDCTDQLASDCLIKEYTNNGQESYYHSKNCEDFNDRFCLILMENGIDICDTECVVKLVVSYKGKAIWDADVGIDWTETNSSDTNSSDTNSSDTNSSDTSDSSN